MGIVINFLDYLANNPWLIIVIFLLYVFIFGLSLVFTRKKPGKNPFRADMRRTTKDVVMDQHIRDGVLKQGFAGKKIDEDFDAIVIGSGIGGLGAAAILSKAGKKVLVLEQHDQAGGCCHTFVEKGFEFDVGIHYIGEMRNNTVARLLVEQLTEGQLCWENLLDELDMVVLGESGKHKFIPFVCAGKDKWKAALLEKFPDEEKALDKFWSLLQDVRRNMLGPILLKTQPRWLSKLLIHTGLLNMTTKYFQYSKMSLKETLDGLTQNKDLKAVLGYAFGDYGSSPNNSSFAMHAALLGHYIYGGSYPKGGASEIAFHLIPVIEKEGGQVLVRAPVSQILCEKGKAVGVRVQRKSGDVDIRAPLIISDAGVINTFTQLLPKEIAEKSRMHQLIKKKVDSGIGAMQLFVGLKGTSEELGLKAQNYWVFVSNDLVKDFESYYSKSSDEASQCDIPLLFVSFPSAKDSTYNHRFPGKSVATIVTLGNWDWFKEWKNERVQKRGDEYEALKQNIGRRMWDQVLNIFPQLADKVEYFEVGTPLSNNYYLNSPKGEIYGLDHTRERFADPEIVTDLRPETDVPGLLLTGQDVLSCGFMGALFGGVLCASKALNRNIYTDLVDLKKQIDKQK